MMSYLLRLVAVLSLGSAIRAIPEVMLDDTTLLGRTFADSNQEFFGGIPYAQPPVGQLRLQPPVSMALNGPAFNASSLGLGCLQPTGYIARDAMTEDCLKINVIRPAGITVDTKLPVLLWVQGGGYKIGAVSQYNGSAIVARSVARGTPVIYVNFGYRIGPLGFPQGQEAADRGALNLGLKDQVMAITWVHDNIARFGGDETKITVFGESGGSMSIAILYLNSGLEKLVRAAIFQSGSGAIIPDFPAARKEHDWQTFVSAIPKCVGVDPSDTFGCLRAVDSDDDLVAAITAALSSPKDPNPFVPNVDGPGGLLPDLPSKLIAQGHFSRLPFIAGTNLDEGTFLASAGTISEEDIRDSLLTNYTPSAVPPASLVYTIEKLISLYPNDPALGSPFNTGNETFGLNPQFKRAAAIRGDLSFHAARRLWIQAASSRGVKTFGYLFSDPAAGNVSSYPSYLGVSHGTEIVYVYGEVPAREPAAQALSTMMIDYWVSFTTSLDPNDGLGSERPEWTQYTNDNQVVLQLDSGNTTMMADDFRKEQIDFINSNSIAFRQ